MAMVWPLKVQEAVVVTVVSVLLTEQELYRYEEEPESVPLIQVLVCDEHDDPAATARDA